MQVKRLAAAAGVMVIATGGAYLWKQHADRLRTEATAHEAFCRGIQKDVEAFYAYKPIPSGKSVEAVSADINDCYGRVLVSR